MRRLGLREPLPHPLLLRHRWFVYTFDPVNDRYTSELDSSAGVYYIYDLITEAFYTYDPASGTYL